MEGDVIAISSPNPWKQLPTEIIESIFAQLPLSDLLTTYTSVCKLWLDIIQNPFFLPWKKLYLSVKLMKRTPISASLLDPARKDELILVNNLMRSLVKKHNLQNLDTFLINLISFMSKVHRYPSGYDFHKCCEILRHHRLTSLALQYLKWTSDKLLQKPPTLWHLSTTIIILSEDVWDIYNLIRLLLSSSLGLTTTDVIEACYSLATFLLHASHSLGLPIRYHYMIYYALYLYENSWQPPSKLANERLQHSGQQSILNFVIPSKKELLTHEQAKIVNHKLKKTDIVKIVAFAGTGKTTTLLRFCRQRPHLKFLLVVYNKSVREHCQKMFPSNTTVRTAHAMAYANVGRRYGAIKKLDGDLKPFKILELLEEKESSGNKNKRAGLVKMTLQKFLNSAHSDLTLQHVPLEDKHGVVLNDDYRLQVFAVCTDNESKMVKMKELLHEQYPLLLTYGCSAHLLNLVEKEVTPNTVLKHILPIQKYFRNHHQQHVILDDAEKVWKEMKLCRPAQRVNMTQDGQLKLWQLSKPVLKGFDVVMIDEGQDMNPTMFDIFLNQEAAKVIVGDPYQQIYAFRGATNALESVSATHTFYLTQSFRFGPEIAFVGHSILEKLLHVSTKTLVGGAIHDTTLANPSELSKKIQRAYLCRSNSYCYRLALSLCKNADFKHKKISFTGGIQNLGLEDVIDIFKMSQLGSGFGTEETLQISNRFYCRFRSLEALMRFAEGVDDKELLNKISMYQYSRQNTLSDVNLLRKRCSGSSEGADVVLSTIHKAKGLEWDWVILGDDMLPEGLRVNLQQSDDENTRAELNLIYVAVTRAKRKLTLNTAVLHTLSFVREKFERLVSASGVDENILCIQCGSSCFDKTREQRTSPIITKVWSLPLSSNAVTLKGGFICDLCASLPVFELPQNPRKLVPPAAESYVKDNERKARYQMLTGKLNSAPTKDQDINVKPIRWDRYHGNIAIEGNIAI